MKFQLLSEHLRQWKSCWNVLLRDSRSSKSKFLLRASDDLAEFRVIDYLGYLSIILLGVNGKERERERDFLHVQVQVTSLAPSLCVCLPLSSPLLNATVSRDAYERIFSH